MTQKKSTKSAIKKTTKNATKNDVNKTNTPSKSSSNKSSNKSSAKSEEKTTNNKSKNTSSKAITQNIPSETASSQKEENELDKVIAQLPKDQQNQLIEIKEHVEHFKEKIINRLEGYVMGVALLPPSKSENEESAKKGEPSDKINVLVLIDDSESTKLSKEELSEKIQKVCDEIASSVNKRLSIHALLLSSAWQECYDAKYESLEMIAMSAIIYDTGMLSAIKIAEVHKTMILKKFEKYIVSYGLAGSLAQGRAKPESDVDVFVVIDDTDVKKMTRTELRDKLRAIIIQMGGEAAQMTGIRKEFQIQVYILTDFWESIKDASPVIFTFLRDGIPFYDRGVFMPWKQLLQMGRIKPSPEAIDMYLSSGKQFVDRIELKLKEIAVEDFYWGLITPSQAALMMYGIPPTTPRETSTAMRDLLVKK
jgi:predicted nucleotidyltransferase